MPVSLLPQSICRCIDGVVYDVAEVEAKTACDLVEQSAEGLKGQTLGKSPPLEGSQ